MLKNAIFQKSMIFYIVAGNMIFYRKLAFWTFESTQKSYIDLPTKYDFILGKVKKIVFLTPKIKVKIFQSRFFWPMSPDHQVDIGDR